MAITDGTEPWWRGAVIYQIYPRSFRDTNGDGVGDLIGIIEKLDYVASLGVDAIWLSPFFASPMTDFGYDVSDYCAVDPLFGTLEDFDRLVARAHALGLKVVIDQVYAHTSDHHAWFQESRANRDNAKADWYVWADPAPDGTPPNNWLSVFYGPSWTWDGRRMQYYMHNFLPSQPNLNVNKPEVQAALFDTARFWLGRGVDGFRLDAINFAMHDPQLRSNPPVVSTDAARKRPFDFQHHFYNQSQPGMIGFIEDLAKAMSEFGDGTFTVAEVGGEQALAEMKAYTQGSARLDTAYSFDFLFAETLSPSLILETLAQWSSAPGEGWPSWAFSNHDAPRAVSRWDDGFDPDTRAKLLLALLMSLRGNVFLYQGEELGLTQATLAFEDLRDPEAIANWPLTQGRDGARTPMPWDNTAPHAGFSTGKPWLPVPTAHLEKSVSLQDGEADSVLARLRELTELRRSNAALRIGDFIPLELNAPLLGFDRVSGSNRVRCIFNLGKTSVQNPALVQEDSLFESGAVDRKGGTLGPWSTCIFETAD
jgi:alpha-glucosidase